MEKLKLSQMAPITAGSAILEAAIEGKNLYIIGDNNDAKTMMMHAVIRGLPNDKKLRVVGGYNEHPLIGEYPMRNVTGFNIIMEVNNAGMDGSVLVADHINAEVVKVMINNYLFSQQVCVMSEDGFNKVKGEIKADSIVIQMKSKGCKIPTVERVSKIVNVSGTVKSEVIYK